MRNTVPFCNRWSGYESQNLDGWFLAVILVILKRAYAIRHRLRGLEPLFESLSPCGQFLCMRGDFVVNFYLCHLYIQQLPLANRDHFLTNLLSGAGTLNAFWEGCNELCGEALKMFGYGHRFKIGAEYNRVIREGSWTTRWNTGPCILPIFWVEDRWNLVHHLEHGVGCSSIHIHCRGVTLWVHVGLSLAH